MNCTNCGTLASPGTAFCSRCGHPLQYSYAQSMSAPVEGYPVPLNPSNGYSTAGIIMGAIAFLFLPIILGPAGLIMGAIAMSKHEPRAVIALVVSGAGLVIGMIFGIIVGAGVL